MESLPPNPILEFYPNQIIEVRKLFGYDDLSRLLQDINILRDWLKKQQHFVIKEYDDEYLEHQLICSKGSIERAKKRIDKLCTLRGLMPEYLQGFDIENEFHNLLKVTNTCFLPKQTSDYYRIIFTDYYNPDSTIYNPQNMARYLIVMVEYLIRYDYCAGIELVCDLSKLTLGILATFNPFVVGHTLMLLTIEIEPLSVRSFIQEMDQPNYWRYCNAVIERLIECDECLLKEALGLRLKGFHCISGGSKLIDTFLAIAKGAMSKKLTSRLHVHDNFETLFKFIPKDKLPTDVGGELPITLNELTKNTLKAFSMPDFIKKIKFIEGAVTDETKRHVTKFNEDYSGMPGSFKVLSVD